METGKIGRLLTCASLGDVEGVKMLLDEGLPVDSPDYDGRTAMHLAASEGHYEVVEFLLKKCKANVNPADRWRKTPLADARRYEVMTAKDKYTKVCEILVEHNGSTSWPFEIDLDVQQLESCTIISECEFGKIRLATWRGTKVAARVIHRNKEQSTSHHALHNVNTDDMTRWLVHCDLQRDTDLEIELSDSQMIKQLSLLQRLRHPNIVQFLGAVTNFQNTSKPLVFVTEYLPHGDLQQLLTREKGRKLQAKDAVNYALDIARGMNYLHRHKPEPIVHSELNPMNLLRDAAGHLKVAGLGLSKLMGCPEEGKARRSQNRMYSTYNAMKECIAPEFKNAKGLEPHSSADVYSFGKILYEMLEGPRPTLASRQAQVVSGRTTCAPNSKLGKLIMECLAINPEARPKFHIIIQRLEKAKETLMDKRWWVPSPLIKMGRTLVTTVSQQWYGCVKHTRRALSHSIASVEDSMRNHGRGRRGEITNFDRIEEEAQDEHKEKTLITQF